MVRRRARMLAVCSAVLAICLTGRGRMICLGVLLIGVLSCAREQQPSNQPTGDRVVLIGVDGATWDVIRPLMAAGRMPTFKRLVDEGWSGVLRSMEPMVSPLIWTTIATGKNADKHGILGFLAPLREGGEPEVPVTSNLRRTEALWTIASRYGRSVNVVGWYVTWPVEAVNGVMVSDRFVAEDRGPMLGTFESITSANPGVYPATLAPELEKLFVRPEDFIDPAERGLHQMFKTYPVDATRTAIAEKLMRERPADLTMVYLWGTDAMQHRMWKYYQPETYLGPPPPPEEIAVHARRIPAYYADVDRFVARIIAGTGPRDTVIIVSDHGFGPALTLDPKNDISGDHRAEGIILAWGNHVRRGVAAADTSVRDVTPTVLYLLGLPSARDMDGQVITDLVAPTFLGSHPVRLTATYERGAPHAPGQPMPSPVDDAMRDRLRSLGYIK